MVPGSRSRRGQAALDVVRLDRHQILGGPVRAAHDTSQIGGPDAVRARVAAALAPMTTPSNRKPVLEARRIMGAAITRFFDTAAQHDPDGDKPAPVHAVRVDVAVGKSLAARQGAAVLLAGMRARGNVRTIVFAVPTHALGEEAAAEFEALPAARAAGLTADIWRGRSASDPNNPDALMCRDLDRACGAASSSRAWWCRAPTFCLRRFPFSAARRFWPDCG